MGKVLADVRQLMPGIGEPPAPCWMARPGPEAGAGIPYEHGNPHELGSQSLGAMNCRAPEDKQQC